MKRYLLFYGVEFYPSGGVSDLDGDYYSKESALIKLDITNKQEITKYGCGLSWANILDIKTGKIYYYSIIKGIIKEDEE